MDSKRHLPAAGRMTSWKVAVFCGIAGLTAATWPAPGPAGLKRVSPLTVSAAEMSGGQRLFDHETFGGNGRTCRTCHSGDDGTIDPAEVAERLAEDPSEPLFSHDGLDDFFSGTSRIAAHATILIERDLPAGVVLVDDPSATSVVLARGVPSTVNTPGLDPALMYDMRDADLENQASGAIDRHSQATIAPTPQQLQAIANFQRTDRRFFSSKALKSFAQGGPAPDLPQGHTASEKRGREFFVDAPWNPPSKKGVCALCHSGPVLNTANQFTTVPTGAPPGWRAFDIGVSSRNLMNQPGPHVRRHRSVQHHHGGELAGSGHHDHGRLQHPDAGAVPSAQGVLHPPSRVLREHVQDAAAPWREAYGAVLS